MIADTCFIIDVMRGNPDAVEKAGDLEKISNPLFVTAPTVFELNVGLSLSSKQWEEKERILGVLGSLSFLPLDYSASVEAGRIYGELRSQGRTIDPQDAMIAGIARVSGEKILTRNVRHFQGIREIATESY